MNEMIVRTAESEGRSLAELHSTGAQPSVFHENEARLRDAVSRVEERVRESWASWQRFVDDEIDRKLSILLEEVAASHAEQLNSLALKTESLGEAGGVLEYRRAVERVVVKPVLHAFESSNPGRALQERFRRVIEEIRLLPDEVPDTIRLSEPSDLFSPRQGDGLVISIRKMVHRRRLDLRASVLKSTNRVRRLFGRKEVRPVPASRIVPARSIAALYLDRELPQILMPSNEGRQNHLARRIAGLETALTEWVNATLVEEREAEVLFEGAMRPKWESVAHHDDAAHARNGNEEEPRTDLCDRILTLGAELQERLEELAGAPDKNNGDDAESLTEVFEELRADLAKGGTFLLSTHGRSEKSHSAPDAAIAERAWPRWHDQVVDRLRYLDSLLLIRDRMLRAEASIVDRASRATVMTVISTFDEMKKHFADSLEHIAASARKLQAKGQTGQFAAELTAVRNELAAVILSVFKDLPGLVSSDQFLTEPGREEWEGVNKFVDGLPENLVMHELYDDGEEIDTTARTAEVNFRGLVNDVLLIRLPDRLRKPAEALRSAVRRVWTETEQVQHIVQYNLDTAVDELTADGAETAIKHADGHTDTGEEHRPAPQERIDQARQLSSDGLTRASGILDRLATSLREPWEEFVGAIDRELQEDWVAIHRRLKAADSADEQWAGFRARTTRQVEKLLGRIGSNAASALERIRRVLRTGRRRAESLIRIGQSAVGVADGGEVSRYETIDALSSVHDLRDSLPLIYRRLFSFEPLDEPSLLEGRARDLVWINQHFGRWRTSMRPGVVLVQASLGSGRTSFLYALRDAIFSDFDVRWVNLPERLYHPDDFARLIANVLGLQSPEITIGELEEYLESLKRSDPPQVLLIDNLEHLLMRAPQPTNVIERIILFMSRTGNSVYWVGTIGLHAWQFLSKTGGTAVSFVDSYALSALDRATIESLIINRHRRSGMPLHFTEPEELSTLMRQRLRRAKTPEQRQALLREDYFDRLWKASGENIMLALYYWIRSAHFDADGGTLSVTPFRPLYFDFLMSFDLNQAFTLKAFFLHKTLSLEDHRRIFRTSTEASTAILESLLKACLIEPVPEAERVQQHDHVERDAIYRMKPLIIHPVTAYLRGKNIVH